MVELTWQFRLILCGLACYRLAGLIAYDDGPMFIFKRIRCLVKDKAWVEAVENNAILNNCIMDRWFGSWNNLAEGISCPYCVAVWLSFPLFLVFLFPTYIGDMFLLWMSISAMQTFLENLRSEK